MFLNFDMYSLDCSLNYNEVMIMKMFVLKCIRMNFLKMQFLNKFPLICSVFNKKNLTCLSFIFGMSFAAMTYALSDSNYKESDINLAPSVYSPLLLSKNEVSAEIAYPGLRRGSVCGVTLVIESPNDGNATYYLDALDLFSEDFEVYESNATLVKKTSYIESGHHKDINYIFKTLSGHYIGYVTFKTKSGKTFGEVWKEALSRTKQGDSLSRLGLMPVLCKLGVEETGGGDSVSV